MERERTFLFEVALKSEYILFHKSQWAIKKKRFKEVHPLPLAPSHLGPSAQSSVPGPRGLTRLCTLVWTLGGTRKPSQAVGLSRAPTHWWTEAPPPWQTGCGSSFQRDTLSYFLSLWKRYSNSTENYEVSFTQFPNVNVLGHSVQG